MFYVDHSFLLDSPLIVRCALDGRNCTMITATGIHLSSQIILKAVSGTDRLVYSTSTGIWSRRVFDQKYKRSMKNTVLSSTFRKNIDFLNENDIEKNDILFEDDLQHHLTLDRSSDINDVILIDESLMFVIITDLSLDG